MFPDTDNMTIEEMIEERRNPLKWKVMTENTDDGVKRTYSTRTSLVWITKYANYKTYIVWYNGEPIDEVYTLAAAKNVCTNSYRRYLWDRM